jgi:hypothetical protein
VIGYAIMVQLLSFIFESTLEGTVLRVLFYLSVGLGAGLLRSLEAEGHASAVSTGRRRESVARAALSGGRWRWKYGSASQVKATANQAGEVRLNDGEFPLR